ncbi:MAG: TetR/AcrR family transcriptional regulator, partial [Bryobacteraceae bacterium]
RPRSQRAHAAVLDAALQLFANRGIEGTSMDAIAERSGVSKATIYKHWADKTALSLEALGRLHGVDREQPRFDSGDLRQDLIDFLEHKPPAESDKLREKLMPHLIAYASRNREFGRAWRSYVTEPGRAKAIELMERGIALGYFPPTLDKSLGLALLIGPMMYKHIFRDTAAIPTNLAEGVATAFWRAFSVASPKGRTKK